MLAWSDCQEVGDPLDLVGQLDTEKIAKAVLQYLLTALVPASLLHLPANPLPPVTTAGNP